MAVRTVHQRPWRHGSAPSCRGTRAPGRSGEEVEGHGLRAAGSRRSERRRPPRPRRHDPAKSRRPIQRPRPGRGPQAGFLRPHRSSGASAGELAADGADCAERRYGVLPARAHADLANACASAVGRSAAHVRAVDRSCYPAPSSTARRPRLLLLRTEESRPVGPRPASTLIGRLDFRVVTSWRGGYVASLLLDPGLLRRVAPSIPRPERPGARVPRHDGRRAVRQGRWWTVLTAIYLHGSLLHLVFNLL